MSRPNETELLAWEREALSALRKLSLGGRKMIVSTCGYLAIREAKTQEASKRPVFRLVKGGRP